MDSPLIAVLALLVVLAAVLVAFSAIKGRRLRELQGVYEDVLADHALTMTDRPCGLSDAELAAFELLPVGDRRSSAVWGAEAVELVDLEGTEVQVTCAAFEWWWEDYVETSTRPGHERSSRLAALVTFPATDAYGVGASHAETAQGADPAWEWHGRSLLLALPPQPRGIIRSTTSTDDLVSTSPAPIAALPGLRTTALALAAKVVRAG